MLTLSMPYISTLLVFDECNRLLCREDGERRLLPTTTARADTPEASDAQACAQLKELLPAAPEPQLIFEVPVSETVTETALTANRILFAQAFPPNPGAWGLAPWSIESLGRHSREQSDRIHPDLLRLLPAIREHSIRIPYLAYSENHYIYRFRTEKERNRDVYRSDPRGRALYQSRLCEAIKNLRRTRERTADAPALLDFGPVRYVVPSHFGFCLGVQNAIERAYETILENPDRRVFMLSELIHNPFVNDDLIERGLQYLQNDKGRHLTNPATGRSWWEELTPEDIVIIPAFGATDSDKRRLIEKGLPLNRYDATCMLVEKVWKAARRYGQEGYTVIIHGKAEHEETKATFSNSAKHAPSLIVRDLKEMQHLGNVILMPNDSRKLQAFREVFEGRTSEGFDPCADLDKIAIVNQTTLLRNETLALIDHLEGVFAAKYGADHVSEHLCQASRGDTLCYATQVNQDALGHALARSDIDFALVIGGKNSSNTYQLHRMCEKRFGSAAFYLQSEKNILGPDRAQHYVFASNPGDPRQGRHEIRPLLQPSYLESTRPVTFLVTGGASCPDGIIQQVIHRINGFFPESRLRSIEEVLASLPAQEAQR